MFLQFKALVTPCLSACEPAKCDVRTHDNMIKTLDSYGRRRKRSVAADALGFNNGTEEELIVMQTIKIMDSFNANSSKRRNKLESLESWEWSAESECSSLFTIVIVCSLFLIGQLLIICVFTFIWNRKHSRSQCKRQLLSSDLHSLSNFTSTSSIYSAGGTIPRAQLVYPSPYDGASMQSKSARSNPQVPNFLLTKNKPNASLYNQPGALYNANLFN